jgi:hypothetical protein
MLSSIMLTIEIPDNNIPERDYVISTLFRDFIGLDYKLNINPSISDCLIRFDDSLLIIKDSLFSLHRSPLSYLDMGFLTSKVIYSQNEFTCEENIPVIFGIDLIQKKDKVIECGIDIFASAFFMLTRWEEYVNKARDIHDRFPGAESVAWKNNFLHRPVVNEYAEMLWNMMQKLNYRGARRFRKFELVLTHDIDHLDYPGAPRIILGDMVKRRSLPLAFRHFRHAIRDGNPYDTFDFIMSTSEKIGVKSHFYFMSAFGGLYNDPENYLKTRRFISKIGEIKKRGHITGFHPGYHTFRNPERFRQEKQLLEEAISQEIHESRQHYLRMDVTKTLSICDENNVKIDSSLGFHDHEGFRCGTGDMFYTFDFLKRIKLRLQERPLIIMDSTLRHHQHYSVEEATGVIQNYITIAQKYSSLLTILFHNSSFYGEWEDYRTVYENAMGVSS